VANSIGLYCHRAKIWEDFQGHLQKIEASLLLNSAAAPRDKEKAILASHYKDVVNMIDVVKAERGQWTVEKSALDFKSVVYEEIESGLSRYSDKRLNLVLDGNFQNIPVLVGDPYKLRQLFQTIVNLVVSGSPVDGTIKIGIRCDNSYVTFNFEDQADGGPQGPIYMSFAKIFDKKMPDKESETNLVNWGLVTCKRIVDAHKDNIWAESKGPGQGRLFSFSLPFTPDEHLNNTLKITSEILERLNS
jgi:K+-sensing histidine kinase KdpD